MHRQLIRVNSKQVNFLFYIIFKDILCRVLTVIADNLVCGGLEFVDSVIHCKTEARYFNHGVVVGAVTDCYSGFPVDAEDIGKQHQCVALARSFVKYFEVVLVRLRNEKVGVRAEKLFTLQKVVRILKEDTEHLNVFGVGKVFKVRLWQVCFKSKFYPALAVVVFSVVGFVMHIGVNV